jgi:hypothetical protein
LARLRTFDGRRSKESDRTFRPSFEIVIPSTPEDKRLSDREMMTGPDYFDLAMFWPDCESLTEDQLDRLIDVLLIGEDLADSAFAQSS